MSASSAFHVLDVVGAKEDIAKRKFFGAKGFMNQKENKVRRNQQKPMLIDIVASLLLKAGLFILNDNMTWKITQRNAICQRLFNTAQPNACRKFELPNGMPIDF
jgi:hypothetical protein